MELVSEQDSDTHIYQKMEDISAQSDSDTTNKNFTKWTVNTNCPTAPLVHKFTGSPSGLRQTEEAHNNKDSSPLSIFVLFFFEIIQLLVEETNRYYHQYLDTLDEERSPLPDVTVQEMCLFLAIIVQMGHTERLLVGT